MSSYVLFVVLHYVLSRRLVHFFVLPLGWMLSGCALVGVMAAWDLYFAESLPLRWGMCAAVVIPLGLVLLRQVRKKDKGL